MQACAPKSFQSLLKLERRARIVPALEGSEKTVRGDYEMGNPSLFNVLEIFDQAGPSIFTAIEELLGLRLESRKTPIEVLIVDSADKPLPN
jgi:uncharacterized protein (TIGR03435 family)